VIVRGTVLVVSVLALVHDVAALVYNPDFGIGAAAQTEKFLWVDYNGWHALLGLLIFTPGLVAWRRADWARVYALAIATGLLVTAIWGLLDTNPLGVLSFPDAISDAIFHIGIAAIFVLALFADSLRRPATT
jgi:hypothetical protein